MIDVGSLLRPDEPFLVRQPRPDLLDDDAFLRFARTFEGLRVESDNRGVVSIVSPTGWESGARNAVITEQLSAWARRTRIGRATDSSALYHLGPHARRAPDAAWISNARLAAVSVEARRGILPVPPDFVIELVSPTDTLDELHDKMREYLEAGVILGWLIDPESRTVYEYRGPGDPREIQEPASMTGDPLLPGFVLDFADIWR